MGLKQIGLFAAFLTGGLGECFFKSIFERLQTVSTTKNAVRIKMIFPTVVKYSNSTNEDYTRTNSQA